MNNLRCEGCADARACAPSDRLCRQTDRSIPPACAYREAPEFCPLRGAPAGASREARLVALLRRAAYALSGRGSDEMGLVPAIWRELQDGMQPWRPDDGPDDADRGASPYGRTR